ncbi:GntR family transcriptional regulator [Arthrobacter sp. NicSoilB8]|uniref:GntR family transcriptional regulator n=1 Tax=Arthrobacter sp. NicSoilB8 TaxID=2830998 RepID=UPI001CC49AA9|nr:GntR family transcriptional regulator [Arthrobacter sp. NicSoilB8]BCW73472.1 putative transcriptional regulator, GntR family protein [Arthrobacter sp. NicSoilB8]
MGAATPAFGKLTNLSMPEMITAKLRAAIADGVLADGQQLVEPEVAAGFGVSRGTVREAMQRLVQEGLLTSFAHRGVFVTEISPDDIVDIYNARRAIETSAALNLASSPDSTVLDSLRKEYMTMARSVDTGDSAELTRADQRFHEILVASLRNSRLERMSETFLVQTRQCIARLEGKYALPHEAVDEHLDIISAIESGDSSEVLLSINRHMDGAIALLTAPTPV